MPESKWHRNICVEVVWMVTDGSRFQTLEPWISPGRLPIRQEMLLIFENLPDKNRKNWRKRKKCPSNWQNEGHNREIM